MKDFHVCGLGNAIVDIFLELTDEEFAALGFERGTMRLVEPGEQRQLIEKFYGREPRLVSGGSVANSIIAMSQLGGKGAFIGCVGDDRYGLFYETEFDELGIEIGNPIIVGETTGTCVCIITPDAERNHAHFARRVEPLGRAARRSRAHQNFRMALHRGLRAR